MNPLTCDCMSCAVERSDPYFDRKEAPVLQLTCNCASRYVKDADHESDCDLWLIDEFWAGFLAWDWDREVLVRTDAYPDDHEDPYTSAAEYEWEETSEEDLVQAKLSEMDQRDRDIALTTDKFIERMLDKAPEDEGATWSKNSYGAWVKTTTTGHKTTTTSIGRTPGSGYTSDYDDDGWGGWSNYGLSDRHCETPLFLPDGTRVQGTSVSKAGEREYGPPDFGLYLDGSWRPTGMAVMLPWRDYGLPNVSFEFADYAIKEAFSWAQAGAIVEIGCIGGHGRTGTVMACMVILADDEITPEAAVQYVRGGYCDHAIETREQEWYVARFAAVHRGTEVPDKPVFVPKLPALPAAAPKAEAPSSGPGTGAPRSAGPTGKGRARRSKRGGKRQHNHRNRMNQGSRR